MKKAIKKFMAALLAVAMLCAMAVPAFAAPSTDGSITIGKAVSGETYDIYELFQLDSFDSDAQTYSYTVKSEWKSFFEGSNPGASYITLTDDHPTWNTNKDETTKADFAKAALEWAKRDGSGITATDSKTAAGETVTFTGLELGYYLVDTSLGSLCNLTTTAKNAQIDEKNEKPDIDKKIKNGDSLVGDNSAQIGATVEYEVTVTVQKGTTGYVVRDTMSNGLTFNADSVKVNGQALTDSVGTLNTSTSAAPYTFTLEFADSYILNQAAGTKIKVTYSATINENAQIGGNGNTNNVSLKYGNNSESSHKEVTTKVYEFDLVKVDGTSKKLLSGAQFKLYGSADGNDEIKLVKDGEGYRVATAEEITAGKTVEYIETNDTKAVRISGLASGVTYYLDEVKAPDGYNPLTSRKEFNLDSGSNNTTMTGNTWTANDGGILVENNAGATLPSTGGMGTTLFYVIGGGLMVAAVILLVTKKRMENK